MFDWGILTKPTLPIAGQPYVDHTGAVWQWDATAQTWARPSHLEMRRTREQLFLSMGQSTLIAPSALARRGTITRNWDSILAKSFVELRNVQTNTIIARAAHMSLLEFDTWFRTVVPNNLGAFLVHVVVVVYEIIDTRVCVTRWRAWNNFYSSFRGRGCYTGAWGYGRSGGTLGNLAGYSPNFLSRHGGIELERRLMQYFYGMDPGVSLNGKLSCWSTRKNNVHKMPSTHNGPIISISVPGGGLINNRWTWDWGSSDWSIAPAGDYEVFNAGLINPNPCYVYREQPSSMAYFVTTPNARLTGLGALKTDGMIAYCLRNAASPANVSFMLKPLGVTSMAAATNILQEEGYHLMAVGKYNGRAGENRYINLNTSGQVVARGQQDGYRVANIRNVHQLLGVTSRGHEFSHSIDSTLYPDQICFYLRHPLTGVRSEEFPNHIDLVRRQNCIPAGFAEGTSS